MTTKEISRNIGDIIIPDAIISPFIKDGSKNRYYAKRPMRSGAVTPAITWWMDSNDGIGGLPAGRHTFEIGIWNAESNSNALETLLTIKDRVIYLLKEKQNTINAGTYATKIRTFDLVSAYRSDEYIGDLKLYFLPCTFDCIIGD